MSYERLLPIAKSALIFPGPDQIVDPRLWEHTERVVDLVRRILRAHPKETEGADSEALDCAALFHAAGWAEQYRAGQIQRWQVLSKPTSEAQRELAASIVLERCEGQLAARTVRNAGDTIRLAGARVPTTVEARVLSDAENLAEFGLLDIVRQIRMQTGEARPLAHMLDMWKRQIEYGYWDLRIEEGLHFDSSRRVARARLAHVQTFAEALFAEANLADFA
ncbi:MAG: hypothetical protein SF069_13675 [Phycisphaerae bacterium]|nr:hypothetical protein [Phycisphaerae bacterium]